MRASRILAARPERAYHALSQLCEERNEDELRMGMSPTALYVPPRLSLPPQTPYSIGSSSFRPNGTPQRDRLSPPRPTLELNKPPKVIEQVQIPPRNPPDHMAPKRGRWTSPPPIEANVADHSSYETRLGLGLSLATAASEAREREKAYMSSSSNSEILSDDGDLTSDVAPDDDVRSVQSFAGETNAIPRLSSFQTQGVGLSNLAPEMVAGPSYSATHSKGRPVDDSTPTPPPHNGRGRRPMRPSNGARTSVPPVSYPRLSFDKHRAGMPIKPDLSRRTSSGSPRSLPPRPMGMGAAFTSTPHNIPLPPSPIHHFPSTSPTIYYETKSVVNPVGTTRSSSSLPQSPVMPVALYPRQFSSVNRPETQAFQSRIVGGGLVAERMAMAHPNIAPFSLPPSRPLHAHSHSSSTIIAPITPSAASFARETAAATSLHSSPSSSPLQPTFPFRPSFSPSLARRPSLGVSASPVATSSLGSPSPPSSSSSRSGSVCSVSPTSSTSPQTADLSSPLRLSPSVLSDNSNSDVISRRRHLAGIDFVGLSKRHSPPAQGDNVHQAAPEVPVTKAT